MEQEQLNNMTEMDPVRYKIRDLLQQGIYHQDELFSILYPVYEGHYSKLRDIITEEKNNA